MAMEEHLRMIIKQNEQLHQVIDGIARTLTVMCENLSPSQPVSRPDPALPTAYDEKDLITIKEAMRIMNVSRSKIDKLRIEGKLITTGRKGPKGPVRLVREDVENARKWYSIPKGKV